ncbi:hypothetical protein TRFO_24758 [Tritrichomonas foetus]|uniref:Uncharacterized protein n=1 Tax=Tritrichomonas foetus TaxID=1144522 RepID=A0A1J4K825_9EUKA|nr:hypothetical protein TRFO_24758 [Tritrichomonas foetus]|eukprot:OHT07032.1 hypothetical protein TRFO_24758 [Tritrichomonas foetus]
MICEIVKYSKKPKFISHFNLNFSYPMLKHALECARESIKAKTSFMLFLDNKNKKVIDEGHEFIFHYFNKENYKYHKGVQSHENNDPLLPPYPPFCEVAHIKDGADHFAFINLYQTSLGHIVISCANPHAKQNEHLNESDCAALSQVICAYENKGIAYFNHGLESGCSQMHKHMQYSTLEYQPLLKEMCEKKYSKSTLGIKYFSVKLNQISPSEIYEAYQELRKEASWQGSYNFIISNNYAVFVPRKLSIHPLGISLNSLGVCGHYFVYEDSNPEIEKKPLRILRDSCIISNG